MPQERRVVDVAVSRNDKYLGITNLTLNLAFPRHTAYCMHSVQGFNIPWSWLRYRVGIEC